MLKLLKNFFGANTQNSIPSAWTDESWNADSYEKMLVTGTPARIGGLDDGSDGLFGGMFSNGSGSMLGSDDGASLFNDNQPAFNIDGTPMMGSIDVHGNPYGITGDHAGFDSSWSSSSDSFGSSDSFDSGWSSDNHF
jgi:hypothetical protein